MSTLDVALGALALPAAPAPRPGVLLLPDVFGLSPLYRGFAARLADEGFVTLALDPYGGPVAIEEPGRFLRERSDIETMVQVRAGLAYLGAHPTVAGARLGVLGFCIGGTQALLAACSLDGLSACVSCYGILSYEHGLLHDPAGRDLTRRPHDPLTAIADLRCPLLGLFGEQDEFVPLADVDALEAGAAKTRWRTEIRRYPGAGHAFLNETRPAAHRPDAARDAWSRIMEFLRLELPSVSGI